MTEVFADEVRTKRCTACQTRKTLSEFYFNSARQTYVTQCKTCYATRKRANRAINGRGERRDAVRRHVLRAKYDMTPEDYASMLEAQGGVCAICAMPERTRHRSGAIKNLSVDHCHTTGRVRGLLCARCNRGIGLLGDSPERITEAAAYLRRWNAV